MVALLANFLSRGKQRFLAGPGAADAALVYLGNAAGDLDTIVSAVALAFVRAGPAPDALHVPVMPFARADFRLRQDASLLFSHCGFEMDTEGAPCELLFWDEISDELATAWRAARLGLVLTDHNKLAPSHGKLGSNVQGIVDHHQDEKQHLATCDGPRRVLDTAAGSACSLVALEARAGATDGAALDAGVGLLLLATAAADCRGFDPKQRRFDWADAEAASWLVAQLGGEPPAPPAARDAAAVDAAAPALRDTSLPPPLAVGGAGTVGALGERLLAARYDVSSLTAADLLRLDYKEASSGGLSVGVAAIFVSLAELTRRCDGGDGLASVLGAFAQARGVDLIVAMTAGDDADAGRKGVALMPAAGSPAAATAAASLQKALQGVPAGLPADLASQPLFVSQRVSSDGFGLAFGCAPGAPEGSGLVTSTLFKQITRAGGASQGVAALWQ